MQASYEARVADQQLALDELNSAMISTADRFKAEADALEAKERTLTALVQHKQALRASLGLDPVRATPASVTTAAPTATGPVAPSASEGASEGDAGTPDPAPNTAPAAVGGSGDLPMLPKVRSAGHAHGAAAARQLPQRRGAETCRPVRLAASRTSPFDRPSGVARNRAAREPPQRLKAGSISCSPRRNRT